MKQIATVLLFVALAACNAESPTALADFNAASVHGKWSLVFSGATCTVPEIEMSFTQFSSGGALPEEIRLIGSWQVRGEPQTFNLEGTLTRDTGEIFIELITGSRTLHGLVMDNENLALAYTDSAANCSARASARRIQ